MGEGDMTNPQTQAVIGVSAVTSTLSMVGSAFILFCFFKFTHLRKFAFSLVAILSATDILNQVFDLIEPSSDNMIAMLDGSIPITTRCYVQAVGDSFFELSSVLWTTAIAATLYCTVIWRWTFENNVLTFLKFSAWCYGIPLVLTVAPAIDHAFGPAGAACWIKEEKAYWQFISFYIPLWIAVAFNGYAYWKVLRTLHSTIKLAGPNDPSAENIRKVMKRLSVYPFILVIVWTVESINAIVSAATGNSYFALALIGATLACTQGMLNCLAYGLSSGVRDAIRDMLAPYCKCVRPSQALATQVLIAPAAGGGAGKDNATSAATVPATATAPRFTGAASPGDAPLGEPSKVRAHSAQALDEDIDDRALAVPPPATLSTPVR